MIFKCLGAIILISNGKLQILFKVRMKLIHEGLMGH